MLCSSRFRSVPTSQRITGNSSGEGISKQNMKLIQNYNFQIHGWEDSNKPSIGRVWTIFFLEQHGVVYVHQVGEL